MAVQTYTVQTTPPGDYTTVNGFESGEQTDLVTAGDIAKAVCDNIVDSTAVTFDGWTTDATNYIWIANASDAIPDFTAYTTTTYRHENTDTGSAGALSGIYTKEFLRMTGISVKKTGFFNTGGIDYQNCVYINAASNITLTLEKCWLELPNDKSGGGVVLCDHNGSTIKISNTVMRGGGDAVIEGNNKGLYYVHNCVLDGKNHSAGGGFGLGNLRNLSHSIKNCAIFNCNGSDRENTNGTYDYNASDDVIGTNAVDISPSGEGSEATAWAARFEDYANGDYHLKSGTNLEGAGADLDSDANLAVTDDVDGDTRDATAPDIGIDEFVSAGGATIPIFEHGYRRRRQVTN